MEKPFNPLLLALLIFNFSQFIHCLITPASKGEFTSPASLLAILAGFVMFFYIIAITEARPITINASDK